MGQYKLALADYTTLVERAPEDSDYYEYRAAVYVLAGDQQKALDDYNRLISLNPKYPVGYRERAKLYEKLDGKKSPRVVADYATVKKLGY
jgi:tetratricopeptide (TPR) repeat protein